MIHRIGWPDEVENKYDHFIQVCKYLMDEYNQGQRRLEPGPGLCAVIDHHMKEFAFAHEVIDILMYHFNMQHLYMNCISEPRIFSQERYDFLVKITSLPQKEFIAIVTK